MHVFSRDSIAFTDFVSIELLVIQYSTVNVSFRTNLKNMINIGSKLM